MGEKIKIVAIDTSTDFLSVAVLSDGKFLAEKTAYVPRKHSALLPEFLDEVLSTAGEVLNEDTVFAVSVGPGSYTGLRVGVSFVQGLVLGVGGKIVAVDSLAGIAYKLAPSPLPVAVLFDARAGGFYVGVFNVMGIPVPIVESTVQKDIDVVRTLSHRGRIVLVASQVLLEQFGPRVSGTDILYCGEPVPSAAKIAQIAYHKALLGQYVEPDQLEPKYLREFVPGKPKKRLV